MSTEHFPGTIVDVPCRRFEEPTTGGGVRKRAARWDASRDEHVLRFPLVRRP